MIVMSLWHHFIWLWSFGSTHPCKWVRWLNLLSICSDYVCHFLVTSIKNILNILRAHGHVIMSWVVFGKINTIILISIIPFKCELLLMLSISQTKVFHVPGFWIFQVWLVIHEFMCRCTVRFYWRRLLWVS